MATGFASPVGGALLEGTAPVTFTSAAPQTAVDADLVIEWDLDNDGDFSESVEDITTYVMACETIAGRDFPSSLTGKAGAGQLKLTLLNTDGRFSYFNASSPLTTDPFSLRTGRKIRVRTADSSPDDPVLLARDRFRTDGVMTMTETGQAWVQQVDGFFKVGGVARAKEVFSTRLFTTIDVNTNDYYAQCTLRQLPLTDTTPTRQGGFVVRWTDANNYVLVYYDLVSSAPIISIYERDDGVEATIDSYSVRPWEGMTIGAECVGSTITAYVGGVPVASGTTGVTTGEHVGLYAAFTDFTGRSPEIGDFHVWDHIPAEIDGILWTGSITDVTPGITVGDIATATVSAEGVLADAARAKIAAPRLPYRGEATGLVVGDIMARANLLHPPGPIQEGTVVTGPVSIEDGNALTLGRQFEEVERGFLHESNEGYIAYHDQDHRDGASSQAWFSDTPGTGQYRYAAVAPIDHKGQIINEVVAGVAADAPSSISRTNPSPSGSGNVDITLPTTAPGDLLVIFIANSTRTAGEQWLIPIFWVSHRDLGDSYGLRVYTHFCDGSESGAVVEFFANTGAAAGLWVAEVFRIQNWFESYNEGIAMGDVARGADPAALIHGWGRDPTLFIVIRSGLGAVSPGMAFTADTDPPDGYRRINGNIISSGTIAFDAGIASAIKVDCTETEDPTSLLGLSNAITDESVVFAVRGFNGPHTKATLENPRTTGGDGRFVTRSDVDSQDEHNVIRSHQAPALFASEGDAQTYGDAVLDEFADDRPIFALSFWASSSAELRGQAITRRVGDKITVTATGDTNLGVERDFFIEAIGHRWTNAGKLWLCTWQLSPA